MLENKKVKASGVHYSRYIASWRTYASTVYGITFEEWLKSEGCTNKEIQDICEMAKMGKHELEVSAKKFWTEKHTSPYV